MKRKEVSEYFSNLFNAPADYVVYVTNNYDQFHFLDGNRDIGSVTAIKRSIKKYGYLRMPILVNELMEVIEGQHRLIACKELGVPVHYVIQEGLRREHCIALNVGRRNWVSKDYLHSGAIESKDYAYFESLTEKYPEFPYPLVLCTYDGSLSGGAFQKFIKSGMLKCSESDFRVADNALSWLSGFREDIKALRVKKASVSKAIYFALIFAYKATGVDKKRLTKTVHDNFNKFSPIISDVDEIVKVIEEIYNNRISEKKIVNLYAQYREAVILARKNLRLTKDLEDK